MYDSEYPKSTVIRFIQPENAPDSIFSTDGKVMDVRLSHSLKALLPIVRHPSIVTEDNFRQLLKASLQISP